MSPRSRAAEYVKLTMGPWVIFRMTQTNALRPVMARPTTRVLISLVPS
jgi:hypothetical protein